MSGVRFTKNGSGGIPVDKNLSQREREKRLSNVKNPNSAFNPRRIKIPQSIAEQAVRELYGDNPNLVQMILKYGFIFIEPEENENEINKPEQADVIHKYKDWMNKTRSYAVAKSLTELEDSTEYENVKNVGGFKQVLIRYYDKNRRYDRIDLKKYIPEELQYNNPNDRVSDELMLLESKLTQLLNEGWKDINLHQEMKEYLEMLKSKNKEFDY